MKALLFACFAALGLAQSAAANTCRQALALGVDVSGSVDAREYRQQLDGLAQALGSTAVRAALLGQPEAPVEMLVYEWSGPQDQQTLVPWVRISDSAALDQIIAQLGNIERRSDATPGTGLGVAMMRGAQHLAQRPDCWRKTLDISGDGKSNLGPRPRNVKPLLSASGVTINALVIGQGGSDTNPQSENGGAELSAYFEAEVILGADAFVEVALGFENYAAAMEVKLLRELDDLVLSSR